MKLCPVKLYPNIFILYSTENLYLLMPQVLFI